MVAGLMCRRLIGRQPPAATRAPLTTSFRYCRCGSSPFSRPSTHRTHRNTENHTTKLCISNLIAAIRVYFHTRLLKCGTRNTITTTDKKNAHIHSIVCYVHLHIYYIVIYACWTESMVRCLVDLAKSGCCDCCVVVLLLVRLSLVTRILFCSTNEI